MLSVKKKVHKKTAKRNQKSLKIRKKLKFLKRYKKHTRAQPRSHGPGWHKLRMADFQLGST